MYNVIVILRIVGNVMKDKKKDIFLIVSFLFFLFLIVQHQAVFMYHDDYGYACLTYGYEGNAHGMHWNLMDLLRFMNWHYFNWGGRVFYFSFFTIALKLGENFIQIFQATIIFLINIAIYKSCKRHDYDLPAMIVIFFAWFSISISAIIDGVFWYTASAIYVWPFAAFFYSVFFLKSKKIKRRYSIAGGILLFCAGFSQEQVAFFVIVYSLCKIVEAFVIKDKKSILIYLCGILGSIVLLAAPGNWLRAGDNQDFYNLSIIQKLFTNVPKIFSANFNQDAGARVVMYVVLLCVLGKVLLKKWWIVLTDCILGGLFLYGVHKNILFLEGIFVICLVAEIAFYLIKTKKFDCLYIFLGAMATQAMLVVSPVVAPRTCIPFYIPMGYVAAVILVDSFDDGIIVKTAIAVFGIISVVNVCSVTKGYYSNYDEYTYDRKVLEAASQDIKDGKDVQEIELKKLENDRYSGGMPYTIDYIKYWMKDYYEMPQSVEFVWE